MDRNLKRSELLLDIYSGYFVFPLLICHSIRSRTPTNMLELTMEECEHLLSIWKICYLCETTFTEHDAGFIDDCLCLRHCNCPVPRVREQHCHDSCFLELKQKVLTNHVTNTFSIDDVRNAYESFMNEEYPTLMDESERKSLTKKECSLLMSCWRVCYCCETKIDGRNKQRKTVGIIHGCHCMLHCHGCTVPNARDDHLFSDCDLQLKREIVTNYVRNTWKMDSVRTAYRWYMKMMFPMLVREILNEQPLTSELDLSASIDVVYHSELKFIRHVGHGGYGTVDLVEDEFHTMAVKRLNPSIPLGGYELKRELDYLVMVCRHPNLIQIRAVLYQSPESRRLKHSPIGYTMEYMPDNSLYQVIHSSPRVQYDYAQILNWIKQAACGLHYLHEKRIIHRDVKPHNMLLDRNYQVLKICDLGISCIDRTVNTAAKGTFVYMAPEVISVEERTAYSESCDVYSLAISVWEMRHREVPFNNLINNPWKLMQDIKRGERPTIAQDCEPELREIIRSAWVPEIGNRPTMRGIHTFAVDSLNKLGVSNEY